MNSLAEIQAAAAKLAPAERAELVRFLKGLESEAWDHQIEKDVNAGRLDFLIEELEAQIAAAKTRTLHDGLGARKIPD